MSIVFDEALVFEHKQKYHMQSASRRLRTLIAGPSNDEVPF